MDGLKLTASQLQVRKFRLFENFKTSEGAFRELGEVVRFAGYPTSKWQNVNKFISFFEFFNVVSESYNTQIYSIMTLYDMLLKNIQI